MSTSPASSDLRGLQAVNIQRGVLKKIYFSKQNDVGVKSNLWLQAKWRECKKLICAFKQSDVGVKS